MVSNGVRNQVTLHVELAASRSKKSVQTDLDRTVEEFKLVLTELTGIPSDQQCLVYKGRVLKNPQTLRSCELEPDQTIHLLRRGLPLSEYVFSRAKYSTPAIPRMPKGLNAVVISEKTIPQLLDKSLDVIAIIKSIPVLCHAAEDPVVAKMLENSVILRCVLSYLFYLEINRSKASEEADLTKSINVQTEGYKHNCNGGQQARGIGLTKMKQVSGSDVLMEPHIRHNGHRGAIDNFVQILFSDATFLRHYKEQGESIDCAFTAMLGWDDASHDQSSPGVDSLGALHNGDCSLYQTLCLALPNVEDYNTSYSSNEEMVASQLAQMEEMGFLNRQENLSALLKSGADVEKAVERLLEKTFLTEGQ